MFMGDNYADPHLKLRTKGKRGASQSSTMSEKEKQMQMVDNYKSGSNLPQFINISNNRSNVEPASMPEFTVKDINLPQNNKGAAGNEEADLGQTNATFRERNEKHAVLCSG